MRLDREDRGGLWSETLMKAYCLFEQSGTFKNEFIKLGIHAEDYDILNDFGETNHIVDLFEHIRGGLRRRAKFV